MFSSVQFINYVKQAKMYNKISQIRTSKIVKRMKSLFNEGGEVVCVCGGGGVHVLTFLFCFTIINF